MHNNVIFYNHKPSKKFKIDLPRLHEKNFTDVASTKVVSLIAITRYIYIAEQK